MRTRKGKKKKRRFVNKQNGGRNGLVPKDEKKNCAKKKALLEGKSEESEHGPAATKTQKLTKGEAGDLRITKKSGRGRGEEKKATPTANLFGTGRGRWRGQHPEPGKGGGVVHDFYMQKIRIAQRGREKLEEAAAKPKGVDRLFYKKGDER